MATDGGDAELVEVLRAELLRAGLFDPLSFFYWIKGITLTALQAIGYWLLTQEQTGARLGGVLLSALGMVQFGILAHDGGHGSISRTRWVNDFWGYFGMSWVCGMSFSRWRAAHNLHHARSQEQERDPDMQFDLLLAVYEDDVRRCPPLRRRLVRYQAWYFWPLTLFFWLSLRADGVRHLVREPLRAHIDRWVLPWHYALWLVVPAIIRGPFHALSNYVATSCLAAIVTAALFAINHVGMPTIGPTSKVSYLRQQAELSRNITGGKWADVAFGGLNFHIEHHLFPRIGHANLRSAQTIVRPFCRAHGIRYHEQSFGEAVRSVLRRLADVAASEAKP
jgi:fatty acid desaturase